MKSSAGWFIHTTYGWRQQRGAPVHRRDGVDGPVHKDQHAFCKLLSPHQRHCGEAIEICRQRSRVYELARIANPKHWSRSIRCWKQPDLVWINEPLATQQTSLPVALAKEA